LGQTAGQINQHSAPRALIIFKNNHDMKKIYLLLSAAILVFFFAVTSFMRINYPTHQTSFTVKITTTAIMLKVKYDPGQAPQVERYIDSCLQPEIVFGDKRKANKEVQMNGDQLRFHIKGSPGSLSMTADKKSNTASSLDKLKSIFEGLKSVIKPG
jgi:hypothetical protein